MNTHPYVRAYMAGIFMPTIFLLIAMAVYLAVRVICHIPVPIERIIIFPMAIVPNAWGLWNILYVRLRQSRQVSIGLHGALLPFILAPLGFLLARALHIVVLQPSGFTYFDQIHVNYALPLAAVCAGLAIYYLLWKYLVNFFNELLGIA